MSLINNIVRKARPSLFSGNEPCLCEWCNESGEITDSEGLVWPCPQCHLGKLESLKVRSKPLFTPSHFHDTAKAVWDALRDVPVNDDMELEEGFFHFEAGSDSSDVWHWIEDTFEVSVATL